MANMDFKHFSILVPSYNNSAWSQKNLESICGQDYPDYQIIYTDDASTDNTVELLNNFVSQNKIDNLQLIKNETRLGAMHNIYNMVQGCQDDTIVVLVDGDDWLAHQNVLKTLNKAYQDPEVWLTYGSYLDFPGMTRGCAKPYEPEIITQRNYRKALWRASHLRTFYAGLFKKIKEEDFYDAKGDWLDVAWDLAIMLPQLEMSNGKFHYVDEILYEYNCQNPLSDFKIKLQRQGALDWYLRHKPMYPVLSELW